jgi:hypothetical protein
MNMNFEKFDGKASDPGASPEPTNAGGGISILIEIKTKRHLSGPEVMQIVRKMSIPGFQLDEEYEPVDLKDMDPVTGSISKTFILHGTVEKEENIAQLRDQPNVVKVWKDTPIAPMKPQM